MSSRAAAMVLMALVASACTTIHLDVQVDPTRVGKAPTSWAFEDPPSPQEVGSASPSTDLGKRILAGVARGLEANGIRQVPAADAEVLVRYYAAVDQQIDLRRPEYHHWRRFEEGVALGPGIVAEGSLVLEVVDPRVERVIFQGVATQRAERVETLEAHLDEVVQRLTQSFIDSVR